MPCFSTGIPVTIDAIVGNRKAIKQRGKLPPVAMLEVVDRDDEGELHRGDAVGIACEARREGPDPTGRRAHHQKGSLRKAVVTVIRASPDSSRVRAFESMGVTTGC